MISRIVLAIVVVATAVMVFLSDRPWNMTSAPRIAEVAVLPDTPAFADVRRYTRIGSGLFPYARPEPPRASRAEPVLKLGWTYREISGLRLPFWVSDELGFVTYFERPHGLQFGVLSAAQIGEIEWRLGRRVSEDYRFPWYLHLWGWLPFLGLIVWTWLWHREADRAEEARWAD